LIDGRDLTSEDLRLAIDLLNSAFGRWPRHQIDVSQAAHLRWKLEAPGPLPACLHLLEMDARPVAIAVYLPQ
jgi:hypothetical protein